MPRDALKNCEKIMLEAQAKHGREISFKDLLRLVKLIGGLSPLTYKRYMRDLEELGFIKKKNLDTFIIKKVKR